MVLYHEIVGDGTFYMELCLRKFAEHYQEVYSADDVSFLERHGRLIFLSFLKPLVNGLGFFHIESQLTSDAWMSLSTSDKISLSSS